MGATNMSDWLIQRGFAVAASVSLLVVGLIFLFLFKEAAPFSRQGVHVLTHASNPVKALSFDEVSRIFTGETTDWAELGGAPGEIVVVALDSRSYNHRYFQRRVLQSRDYAPSATMLNGDLAVLAAVAREPAAIGFVGRRFIEVASKDDVRQVAALSDHLGAVRLLDDTWIPATDNVPRFGILPLFMGSLLVTLLATMMAIPFGVFGAIYISEIAAPVEREILKPTVELLAGIPSVVLGFFALVVLAPIVKWVFGLNDGMVALTGAIILAFMAVPTIISISEDAIRNVPLSYKEASLALGASRLETIFRVVVPAALSGIIAAIMLGMGRVIGETMAVLMVTGNSPLVTLSPFSPVRTMTATIAAEMGNVAHGDLHYNALFWVGLILLAVTFVINTLAQRALKKHQMRE